MESTAEFLTPSRCARGRPRKWADEEKAQIVSESFQPGARVCDIAKRHGVRPNHLSAWRRQALRGKLVEITRAGTAPIAQEGIEGIAALYRIEAEIKGMDADTRLAIRREKSAPLITDLQAWLTQHRVRISKKSPLGLALAYIAQYWEGLCLFLTDGQIEIDNNSVERTIRPIALNRKNALFAGHDAGAENWAIIASLIETCKLNGIDPHAWLARTLKAIFNGHKQSNIDEHLPWNCPRNV
nr:transposase [Cohaesibacter marisflavi]